MRLRLQFHSTANVELSNDMLSMNSVVTIYFII